MMTHDSETVPAAITRLVDQLLAARAARPPSQLKRMMDDPSLYRRMRDEARQRAQSSPVSSDQPSRLRLGHHLCREPDGEVRWVANKFEDDAEPVEPVKRTRKRKPTLAGVARQVAKAGIEVAGYEMRPDGSIKIITGKPADTTSTDDDTTSPDRSEWN